jgi:hypothetical protein
MKSIRLKYCSAQGCTFKFVNNANLKEHVISEKDGVVFIRLFLKTGEEISLSGVSETVEIINLRWSRFETSDEIFFDLADFEVIN